MFPNILHLFSSMEVYCCVLHITHVLNKTLRGRAAQLSPLRAAEQLLLLLLLLEPLLGVHQLRTQDDISLFLVLLVE